MIPVRGVERVTTEQLSEARLPVSSRAAHQASGSHRNKNKDEADRIHEPSLSREHKTSSWEAPCRLDGLLKVPASKRKVKGSRSLPHSFAPEKNQKKK